ncbi:hypothetical protein [Azohydromonas lata]|uniref:Uncharacterized protein n=1 Tax=Azohydromonas lata TaxID=45677 RepID=A0ABU5INX8_9BURK|nr:hypothetical protein [Azohydromonas lata]MDZ5460603.1 hypothetical protein [Azohydromonas lata]
MNGFPLEYEIAMADLERRAVRGEVTLGQARQEICALRDRYRVVFPIMAANQRVGGSSIVKRTLNSVDMMAQK